MILHDTSVCFKCRPFFSRNFLLNSLEKKEGAHVKVQSSIVIYNAQKWSELPVEKFVQLSEFIQFLVAFVKLVKV